MDAPEIRFACYAYFRVEGSSRVIALTISAFFARTSSGEMTMPFFLRYPSGPQAAAYSAANSLSPRMDLRCAALM